ncbi:hypothetical protein NC651_002236 [Populus alba x Populus x berolinensis]|nr:hypothetical protein NC651_002236 [Populus alba x Populus x berolinensis]
MGTRDTVAVGRIRLLILAKQAITLNSLRLLLLIKAYSYAYDDQTSTFTCAAADFVISFCPSSSSK